MIELENVTKIYEARKVVDSVSLTVHRSEIFGVLGPNGAGKTTLLEMIEGLRPLSAGRIRINGADIATQPARAKAELGVLLQSQSFVAGLKLKELVALFAALYRRRVDPIERLAQVQLADRAGDELRNLSGGMRQRFGICIALINDPKVVILDEPTAGLDVHMRRELWDLIRTIRDDHRTILLSTHYMEEAEELCDRVAIMEGGRVVALDRPRALVDDLLATGFEKPIVPQRANLEDVFVHFTGRRLEA